MRFAWLLIPALAFADDVRKETIAIGQTIERDVGYAIGVMCDDTKIVTAEMKTVKDTNILSIKGEREGTTTCRAGTDPNRVSFVFEITVVKRPRR